MGVLKPDVKDMIFLYLFFEESKRKRKKEMPKKEERELLKSHLKCFGSLDAPIRYDCPLFKEIGDSPHRLAPPALNRPVG